MRYAKPRQYDHTSRYSIYRQILDDRQDMYIETINETVIPETNQDQYHEVLKEEENRLDIISNKYYGTPDYFWIIAMGNNLIDPMIIKEGEILRIPSIYSLRGWNGPLYSRL